ncbi:uncharacterized protein N7479_005302 [Penicillium vulpinum]|uniref:Uncharacterized protein n=1 Tax=Penicillium vulpinum TaxID=29845 RepID=A0A1V6RIC8_9EURO|nr:uncharacterized protein N7479_005302 [Penicillium vulpinum]KAJ5958152.1 hypothetical protein N7479_005302 [Penicillium vulpinum]OQE01258.1 hypothetical protein PENVUL_c043G00039 [Penicillium vulpinum]
MAPNQESGQLLVSVHSNDNARSTEEEDTPTQSPAQSPAQSPRILPVEPHPEPANEPLVSDQKYKLNAKLSIWKLISNFFILEVLAMVLSSGLLVAIVVILTQYDDRPQPNWTLSLNSVISWLSTVSKGSVLFSLSEGIGQLKWVWFTRKSRPLADLSAFDGASRGLYGCAGLIWKLRARHFAVLGSGAIILAIAFDPFVQNLMHYYPKLVPDASGTAIVSSNTKYDALGPPLDAGMFYVDPAMKANIYNSLFNSDSSKPWSTPRYTCSSGNCTWDPIATLEMRASCTDITDRLKTECDGHTSKPIQQMCAVYFEGRSNNFSVAFQLNTYSGTPVAIGSVDPLVYKNGIIPPIQLIAPEEAPRGEALWEHKFSAQFKWQAIECSIDPVVHSFRANVTQGIYHEETLAISKNGSYGDSPREDYYMHPPWGPEMGVEPEKEFMIATLSLTALRYFFADFFAGRARLDLFGFTFIPGRTDYKYASADLMQFITLSNITNCAGGIATKMHCAMDNVAEAMSKAIRDTASYSNPTVTTGQAMTAKTHVSIHWQWIILPVLVWLLGLVTLLGTIWKTRTAMIPTWKNETMPLLSVYRNSQNEKPQGDEVLETEKVMLYQREGKMVLSE